MVEGIFWVLVGGGGWWWVVMGGATVYNSPFYFHTKNELVCIFRVLSNI